MYFGQSAESYGITDSDSQMPNLGGPKAKADSRKSKFWLLEKRREVVLA